MKHTHTWYLVGIVEAPNPEFFSSPSWKIKQKLTSLDRTVTFLRLNLSSALRWSLWCSSTTTGRCSRSAFKAPSWFYDHYCSSWGNVHSVCISPCCTWLSCVAVFSIRCPTTYCRSKDLMAIARPRIDFGLGTRLKGTGSVLPSSKYENQSLARANFHSTSASS